MADLDEESEKPVVVSGLRARFSGSNVDLGIQI
jgi:hypothetical protein